MAGPTIAAGAACARNHAGDVLVANAWRACAPRVEAAALLGPLDAGGRLDAFDLGPHADAKTALCVRGLTADLFHLKAADDASGRCAATFASFAVQTGDLSPEHRQVMACLLRQRPRKFYYPATDAADRHQLR